MSKKSYIFKFLFRFVIRLLVVIVLAISIILLYFHVAGLPSNFADYLLRRSGTPHLALEADSVHINLVRGIIAKSVRIYQKHTITEPLLTADEVQIIINPLELFTDEYPVKSVRIKGAVLRNKLQLSKYNRQDKKSKNAHAGIKVIITDSSWRGVMIKSMSGDIDIMADGWSVDDFSVILAREEMQGRVWGNLSYRYSTRIVSGFIRTKIPPGLIQPWLNQAKKLKSLSKLLSRFEVGSNVPYVRGNFSKELRPQGPLSVKLHIEFADGKYRNVHFDKAETELDIHADQGKKVVVTLDPLIVHNDRGNANIRLVVNTDEKRVYFNGAASATAPDRICGYIGILTNGFFKVLKAPPIGNAMADGYFDYGDRTKTDFNIYVFGEQMSLLKLCTQDYSFRISGKGVTNSISDFAGKLCDGNVEGNGYISIKKSATDTNDTSYAFSCEARDVDFNKFSTMLSGKKSDYRGIMYFKVDANGVPGKKFLSSMKGSGKISIKKGRIFSLPIFGGFSKFMKKIVPGLDFILKQSDANIDFKIGNGKVHAKKIHIDGDVISLAAEGDYYFDGRIDFDIRVRFMKSQTLVSKVLNTVTYPFSKLLAFKVSGTVENPKWSMVNLPGKKK